MSARARFAGFLLLLAGIFGGAYAAGTHVGPVATTPSQVSGPGGGSGTMHMGGHAASARLRGGGP